jgi:hypothetical protein
MSDEIKLLEKTKLHLYIYSWKLLRRCTYSTQNHYNLFFIIISPEQMKSASAQ